MTSTQNIYDNPDFFIGYSQLSRSISGLDGAPEWPSLRVLLPNVRGLKVVDLGCGFGWFCRWAGEQGAAQVTGYDVSEKMLERARDATSDPAISYVRVDLEVLELPEATFSVVYSSLALHYIVDIAGLLEKVYRALILGGHLVFSVEHPIYMAPTHPGFVINADGRKTWPIDRYSVEGPRTTNWLADGVIKQHRTVGTWLNLLIKLGFTISHVEEFCPSKEQVVARPELLEELERPMFLLVSAQK